VYFPVLLIVCQYQSSDWLWRLHQKWPRLCLVGGVKLYSHSSVECQPDPRLCVYLSVCSVSGWVDLCVGDNGVLGRRFFDGRCDWDVYGWGTDSCRLSRGRSLSHWLLCSTCYNNGSTQCDVIPCSTHPRPPQANVTLSRHRWKIIIRLDCGQLGHRYVGILHCMD